MHLGVVCKVEAAAPLDLRLAGVFAPACGADMVAPAHLYRDPTKVIVRICE